MGIDQSKPILEKGKRYGKRYIKYSDFLNVLEIDAVDTYVYRRGPNLFVDENEKPIKCIKI